MPKKRTKKHSRPTSGIPEGKERPVRKNMRADLLPVTRLLLKHLTPALCKVVFKKHRVTERDRKWTLYAVSVFWAALIIRRVPSIEQGLAETRKGRGRDKLWPRVMATPGAFLKKAAGLRPNLLHELYQAFVTSLLPSAPQAYASWMKELRKHFPEIHIVDGSRLEAVRHLLRLLRNERAKVLGGCVTVFYDLFRGIPRQVLFYPDAAQAELPRAQDALAWITKGSLILGDRLYASIQYFHLLAGLGLWGVFRLNRTIKVRRIEVLAQHHGRREFWEDVLIEVGGSYGRPVVRLRLIRYRGRGIRRDVLTNVLDRKKLSAEQILMLYGLRWSIERMFLNLKGTLKLSGLYAAHPNLVAQQVYVTAMVYTAFRVAQARIAKRLRILPEQLSPAKLFPKLAQAINDYCVVQCYVIRTKELNPGVAIRFPGMNTVQSSSVPLDAILLRRREGNRRKRRFCASGKRWKSFTHVRGGRKFLRLVSHG